MFNSSFHERPESIQYNVLFAIVGAIRGISEKNPEISRKNKCFPFQSNSKPSKYFFELLPEWSYMRRGKTLARTRLSIPMENSV